MRPTLVRFSIDFQAGRPIVFIVAVVAVVLLSCHLKDIPHSSYWYVKSCVYSRIYMRVLHGLTFLAKRIEVGFVDQSDGNACATINIEPTGNLSTIRRIQETDRDQETIYLLGLKLTTTVQG